MKRLWLMATVLAVSAMASQAVLGAPPAGTKFRDCAECPEMVVVPAGSFMMGSPESEEERDNDEGPVHRVEFAHPFAMGVYEVTFAEWDACASGGGCGGYRPDDWGWGRETRPVMNVSWGDARSYVRWLREKTGLVYRLPSESEWEYAARAGSRTRYHWGDDIGRNRASCVGCGCSFCATPVPGEENRVPRKPDAPPLAPVGSFRANGFGLYDVHGNVREWLEDCWNASYVGAPTDGSAWKSGDCGLRVLRGGSWLNGPGGLRSAHRNWNVVGFRVSGAGIRVARTLAP